MNIQAIASVNNLASTGMVQNSVSQKTSSGSSSSETFDPRDLNKDGVVSAQEALIYAMSHPGDADSQTVLEKYNSEGKLNTISNNTSQYINIYA